MKKKKNKTAVVIIHTIALDLYKLRPGLIDQSFISYLIAYKFCHHMIVKLLSFNSQFVSGDEQ